MLQKYILKKYKPADITVFLTVQIWFLSAWILFEVLTCTSVLMMYKISSLFPFEFILIYYCQSEKRVTDIFVNILRAVPITP